MNSKEFKKMIKQHKVRQEFVLVNYRHNKVIRWYKETIPSDTWYCATWYIDDNNKLIIDVDTETNDIAKHYWEKYTDQVKQYKTTARQEVESEINRCRLIQCGVDSVTYPMEHRKIAKLIATSLQFILKDARVEV